MDIGEEMNCEVNSNVHLSFALMLMIGSIMSESARHYIISESRYGYSLPPRTAFQIYNF